jgi:hypothetical protein
MNHRFTRSATARLAAIVAACGMAAPAAVAAIRTHDAAPATWAPGATQPPVAVFDASVAARFSVLQATRGTSDPATPDTASADSVSRPADIDAAYARSTGMNVGAARLVADNPKTYAVPGQGVVCIVQSAAGGACTPIEHVGEDFLIQACGRLPRGIVSLTGLVADDVSRIAMRLRDGRAVPVSASRNFLNARLTVRSESDLPVAVELTSGARTASAPVAALSPADLRCSQSSR